MSWGGRSVAAWWELVAAEYGTRCHLCGSLGATTVDHVIPRSAGGPPHALENMRPAHGGCNSARGDRPLDQWFKKHPLPTERAAPSFDWTAKR